ncbi:MAG: hypothetical protein JSV88_28985 [Candidatus Aminicenantes bacterium]|nr:MAG: hypothetical protein JSV88_28985 [Candidatus Aminicenantes bacterium]
MNRKIMMIMMMSLLITTTFFWAAAEKQAAAPQQEKKTYTGRVISTMDSGGYTYIEFEENGRKLWAAGPLTLVYVGDLIYISDAVTMNNFHSKTLNRTFESILFTFSIRVVTGEDGENSPAHEPAPTPAPHGHPVVGPKPGKKIMVTPGSVKKLEGGYTVAECFAMKKELKGKELAVRGIVVKFTPRILGRNWLHIKDGTGEKGSDDLTVTTAESVRVGDLIIVIGIMACDKNFGAGFFYPVIIEDASIIVE